MGTGSSASAVSNRSIITILLYLFFLFASTALALPKPQNNGATTDGPAGEPDGRGYLTHTEDGTSDTEVSVSGVFSDGTFYPDGSEGPAGSDPGKEGQPGQAP